MTKFILTTTRIFCALLVAILFTACNITGLRGDGNVTTTQRQVDIFTAIDAGGGIDVEITQSSTSTVEVVADQNLQEHIITTVSGGVLKISTDENIATSKSRKIIVTMPTIESIDASSGSSIIGKGVFRSPKLQCVASSAGEMTIDIETEEFTGKTSSGGEITMRGKAISMEVSTSSGGDIDATETLSNNIIASASSGGSIKVAPLVKLDASASSGGEIYYIGDPKQSVSKSESSGGSVSKK